MSCPVYHIVKYLPFILINCNDPGLSWVIIIRQSFTRTTSLHPALLISHLNYSTAAPPSSLTEITFPLPTLDFSQRKSLGKILAQYQTLHNLDKSFLVVISTLPKALYALLMKKSVSVLWVNLKYLTRDWCHLVIIGTSPNWIGYSNTISPSHLLVSSNWIIDKVVLLQLPKFN